MFRLLLCMSALLLCLLMLQPSVSLSADDKKADEKKTDDKKPDEKRADAKKDDAGWVQLFNGKDLTGWKTHPKDKAKWEVKDGSWSAAVRQATSSASAATMKI